MVPSYPCRARFPTQVDSLIPVIPPPSPPSQRQLPAPPRCGTLTTKPDKGPERESTSLSGSFHRLATGSIFSKRRETGEMRFDVP